MTLYDDLADIRLLRGHDAEPAIRPRLIVVHTMVGSLRGTEAHFDRLDVKIESHFGIGGPTDDGGALDGAIWQWQDTHRQADANYRANDFAISIETSDGGDPSRPWSEPQRNALVRLIGQLCDDEGIPRALADRWDGEGLGWHVMFGAPGPWTPVAKSCPGGVRIAQFRNDVLPRTQEADVLTDDDKRWLLNELAAELKKPVDWNFLLLDRGERAPGDPEPGRYPRSHAGIREAIDGLREALDLLPATLAERVATRLGEILQAAGAPTPDAVADELADRLRSS